METEETHFLQLSRSTAADIVEKASAAAFGQPLVANYLRSQIVEAMVAEALAPEWKWVSASWAGWDFQSEANDKLEVKQSAAKQTWAPVSGRNVKSSFDIAARTGHWIGEKWIKGAGRNADIYIFAHHPVDDETADHRDPKQWVFYVLAESSLRPTGQKTISLSTIQKLTSAVTFVGLRDRVRQANADSI